MLHSKTWRSVFYVSAAIAALIAVGGALPVDPDQPSKEKGNRVDWVGSLLITSGLALIMFVLGNGPLLLKAGALPVSINFVWLRQRIRTIWELPR